MWPDGEDDEVGRGVVGAEAAERGAADEAFGHDAEPAVEDVGLGAGGAAAHKAPAEGGEERRHGPGRRRAASGPVASGRGEWCRASRAPSVPGWCP